MPFVSERQHLAEARHGLAFDRASVRTYDRDGRLWTSILALIIAGTVTFTGFVPGAWEPLIVKAAADFFAINNVILTAAKRKGLISGATIVPGPNASTVAKIMILALAVTALLTFGGKADAQVLPGKARPVATSPAAASPADSLQKIMDQISAKTAAFVSGVIAAIREADDDAARLTNRPIDQLPRSDRACLLSLRSGSCSRFRRSRQSRRRRLTTGLSCSSASGTWSHRSRRACPDISRSVAQRT